MPSINGDRTVASTVLPDEVSRSETASGTLLHVRLHDEVDRDGTERLLRELSLTLDELRARADPPIVSATTGLGRKAFQRIVGDAPVEVGSEIEDAGQRIDADVAIYIVYTEEWALSEFEAKLAKSGAGTISSIEIHEGFQRPDGREPGGFKDGLRNAPTDRAGVVFTDRDHQPDEPPAADGGTYMVTMKIRQDDVAWSALSGADQEQIIGRRRSDGSRIDLAEGTPIGDEPADLSACPVASHVAKAGPRGPIRDRTQIFRRGLPYSELRSDGTFEHGLLFVSFQASVEQFIIIFNEWMNNTDFPHPGAGRDALIERELIEPLNHALYFVPADDEFIGAQFFRPPAGTDRCLGHVVVRKRLEGPDGQLIRSERGGFTFQLFTPAGDPASEPFVSDSTGRAVSGAVPVGDAYVLREIAVNGPFQLAPDQTFELTTRRLQVAVTNTATQPNPGYST